MIFANFYFKIDCRVQEKRPRLRGKITVATDTCARIRRQIASHRRAVQQLRQDREASEGIAHEYQVGSDPEGIDQRVREHEEKIVNFSGAP